MSSLPSTTNFTMAYGAVGLINPCLSFLSSLPWGKIQQELATAQWLVSKNTEVCDANSSSFLGKDKAFQLSEEDRWIASSTKECVPFRPLYGCVKKLAHSSLSHGISTMAIPEEKNHTFTGKVKEISLSSTKMSSQLSHNLYYGREIVRYVQSIIPISANFIDRVGVIKERTQCTIGRVWSFLKTIREREGEEERIRLAATVGIGNCGEMAKLGYQYAKGVISVRKVRLLGGDHAFLIIGKGDSAVVSDPWSGAYYPFFEASRYLRNYLDIDSSGHPKMEPFDPKKIVDI